ncbi:hypothetical protein KIPB_010729 [Kipferlia bialata]|uniref:Uncharacterized protein n=1 Tax=Kipferlia bialata TaxID=797122 RepID=A0A391NYZ9_9EUKA|nr:hypothetical protein KIPB_010729 [Kipferlia bialata]|eukprot:g10729.t1
MSLYIHLSQPKPDDALRLAVQAPHPERPPHKDYHEKSHHHEQSHRTHQKHSQHAHHQQQPGRAFFKTKSEVQAFKATQKPQ